MSDVDPPGIGGYPVQMRWRDLDGMGHVNHSVVLTYLEEGRDEFLAQRGIASNDYVVGRCTVSYLHEISGETTSIFAQCSVSGLGRSSVTTSERIVDGNGQVVVEAEFVLVMWDASRRGSRPITDVERVSLMREERK